jgi:hypothetical protein
VRIVGLRHAKKGSTIVEAWEIIGQGAPAKLVVGRVGVLRIWLA